ncbi:MAG: cytochrome P450 [Armatimonadota bacterium]|nr:cytochrome P450 [Armatimonadota bacterium]MDW8155692.1 cytochrome P450 [Armatimonadota bacterium]
MVERQAERPERGATVHVVGVRELLRHLPVLRDRPEEVLLSWGRRASRWQIALPGSRACLLFDPPAVEAVLRRGSLSKRTFQYRELERLTGRGLLNDEGESWRAARRLLSLPFGRRAVEAARPELEDEVRRFFDGWRVGQERELGGELCLLSARMLRRFLRVTFSARTVVESVEQAVDHIFERSRNPWRRWSPWAAVRFAEARAALWREAARLRSWPPMDGLPPARALAEATTLLVAGHETVASSLVWAALLCAETPVARERLVGDPRFARWVYQEAVRLFPPAWLITRRVEEGFGLEGLGPGTLVVLSPYVTQRLWFPEGERFIPERFQSEPEAPSGRYFPFGLGPRVCVGRELALVEGPIVLQELFSRFRLQVLRRPKVRAGITLRPDGGLPVRLEPA